MLEKLVQIVWLIQSLSLVFSENLDISIRLACHHSTKSKTFLPAIIVCPRIPGLFLCLYRFCFL